MRTSRSRSQESQMRQLRSKTWRGTASRHTTLESTAEKEWQGTRRLRGRRSEPGAAYGECRRSSCVLNSKKEEKGPIGHYQATVPIARNKIAKSAVIERHPLLGTTSRNDPPGVARLAMAHPTLRSFAFRSAPL